MNNYKEVKNYLHNELGITKQYIEDLIKYEVQSQVSDLINNKTYIESLIKNIIRRELKRENENSWHWIYDTTSMIENTIIKTIVDEVHNKVEIKLKE